MSVTTPTAHTVHQLRREGWHAEKVEQRLPIPGGRPVTKDWGGFGDILACHPLRGILLVQATSRPNIRARILKASQPDIIGASKVAPAVLRPNPIRLALLMWLRSGGHFEVWGWDKAPAVTGKRGRAVRVKKYVASLTPGGALEFIEQEEPPCP